jgi:hypothetical protein
MIWNFQIHVSIDMSLFSPTILEVIALLTLQASARQIPACVSRNLYTRAYMKGHLGLTERS